MELLLKYHAGSVIGGSLLQGFFYFFDLFIDFFLVLLLLFRILVPTKVIVRQCRGMGKRNIVMRLTISGFLKSKMERDAVVTFSI